MPRMLIVEDEADIADCLRQFFGRRGFSVEASFSGEEAIERLQARATDVVLLDLMLPGVSGLEVLKRVKALYPDVKVVIVTGVDQDDVRETARRFGAAAYITKPFDFSDATWSPVFAGPKGDVKGSAEDDSSLEWLQ